MTPALKRLQVVVTLADGREVDLTPPPPPLSLARRQELEERVHVCQAHADQALTRKWAAERTGDQVAAQIAAAAYHHWRQQLSYAQTAVVDADRQLAAAQTFPESQSNRCGSPQPGKGGTR